MSVAALPPGECHLSQSVSQSVSFQVYKISPPRLEQESAGLSISPRLLNLVRGGEGLLRLSNRGSATLSWELPGPPAAIQVFISSSSTVVFSFSLFIPGLISVPSKMGKIKVLLA